MASSKFIEILDNTTAQQHQMSSSDVKLEDVLADQEATVQNQRSRSSTQSSSSRKSQEYTTSTNANDSGNNPQLSVSRDDSQSPSSSASSSPSSSATSSPTSTVPRIRRLRKFTLTGGFGR